MICSHYSFLASIFLCINHCWAIERILLTDQYNTKPAANPDKSRTLQMLKMVFQHEEPLRKAVDQIAQSRSKLLEDAHRRVRKSAKMKGGVAAEPVYPIDFLGCFILAPK